MTRYAQVAYTESVRQAQRGHASPVADRHPTGHPDHRPDPLTVFEAAFIGESDGFYLGSVGDTGWPYIQYRGGPAGFVHVLDTHTLAYADVRGNRQYITTGNIGADDRVALFFMDYASRARLKLFGHATAHDPTQNPDLAVRLGVIRTPGSVERLIVIDVEGFNWNCSQHITPRWTEAQLADTMPRPDEATEPA
ncbi:pyridoxamine 5'-phosphate oxidase family protein [Embleya sp. MST-111070]|uniref:pyridoxamine 5'-phosphate oxidase family protein n=1 Tax=Embleya sp. MST-111070 TaxID=3398231 RepID=UPI003F73F8B9